MLLDLAAAIREHEVVVHGVLHVGAHTGQEMRLYEELGARTVVWVEANPAVIPRLKARVEPHGHIVLEALLADEAGREVDFRVTNNELSSSMLPLGTHAAEHPEIVVAEHVRLTTDTLDALVARHSLDGLGLDLLVLDVQGAELEVLRGGVGSLPAFDAVCLEVNEQPLYEGCALLPEVEAFLAEAGFERAVVVIGPKGYGDGLFVRPVANRSTPTVASAGTPGSRRSLRGWTGDRARGIVSGATDARFDRIDGTLDVVVDRLIDMETALHRMEHELRLLRARSEDS